MGIAFQYIIALTEKALLADYTMSKKAAIPSSYCPSYPGGAFLEHEVEGQDHAGSQRQDLHLHTP